LFRCNVTLSIPIMCVLPTPEEVQSAVVQAVKLIVGSLRRVAQWSLEYIDVDDADQRPTTSLTVTGRLAAHGRSTHV